VARQGLTNMTIGTTRVSDFNMDLVTNLSDASILLGNWQATGKTFQQGDATADGTVNLSDASALLGNWQAVNDTTAGTGVGSITADGSIMLDVKGLGLYKVFVGNANHEQVSGTNFLTFAGGGPGQDRCGSRKAEAAEAGREWEPPPQGGATRTRTRRST
jgi:hypothetical protein